MNWPKLSLVTPSFNQGRYLRATIESVLQQEYPDLEFIIVDGGSSDESIDIIRSHEHRLTWWVSEPDGGQADALVKGFARCSGELWNWLNADDLLMPGALHAVARAFLAHGRPELIAGEDRSFTDDPAQPVGSFQPSGYNFPGCLRFWDSRFRYHQPCTFFSSDAYRRSGGLDARLHYAMDYDLYCRILALPGCSVHLMDEVLSAFRLHPDSKTSRAKAGFIREMREVSQRYWPADWGARETAHMNRYSGECSMFQAAEAFRRRAWREGIFSVGRSLRYAPLNSALFAWRRLAAAS